MKEKAQGQDLNRRRVLGELYISHAHCASVSIRLASVTVVWMALKERRILLEKPVSGAALWEMCWDFSQRGSHPQLRGPSL